MFNKALALTTVVLRHCLPRDGWTQWWILSFRVPCDSWLFAAIEASMRVWGPNGKTQLRAVVLSEWCYGAFLLDFRNAHGTAGRDSRHTRKGGS